MSERGSFVTEYINCDDCLKATKNVLLHNHKYLCSRVLPAYAGGRELPIIAGKIGALNSGGEIMDFENNYVPVLEKVICHPLRIAVLGESGERIFEIIPKINL